jgi:hypothetical protein
MYFVQMYVQYLSLLLFLTIYYGQSQFVILQESIHKQSSQTSLLRLIVCPVLLKSNHAKCIILFYRMLFNFLNHNKTYKFFFCARVIAVYNWIK